MRVLTLASVAVFAALSIAPSADAGSKVSAETSAKATAHQTARAPARTAETVTSAQLQADATVDPAEVIVPGRARAPGQPISPLPAPGVTSRGAVSGGVGVTVAPPLSSNRQPSGSGF